MNESFDCAIVDDYHKVGFYARKFIHSVVQLNLTTEIPAQASFETFPFHCAEQLYDRALPESGDSSINLKKFYALSVKLLADN